MGEKLWGRLINAAVLATYVPIVGTVWSGAWDDLAASLYVRFVGPAPAVLAAYRVKATVITAASVFVVAFYGPYLADFCRSLWGLTLMRDSGPAEPAYTLNVYDLHVRVATSLLMSGASSTAASANSIYDRLQTGELRAWGRVSRGFRPLRSALGPRVDRFPLHSGGAIPSTKSTTRLHIAAHGGIGRTRR